MLFLSCFWCINTFIYTFIHLMIYYNHQFSLIHLFVLVCDAYKSTANLPGMLLCITVSSLYTGTFLGLPYIYLLKLTYSQKQMQIATLCQRGPSFSCTVDPPSVAGVPSQGAKRFFIFICLIFFTGMPCNGFPQRE